MITKYRHLSEKELVLEALYAAAHADFPVEDGRTLLLEMTNRLEARLRPASAGGPHHYREARHG